MSILIKGMNMPNVCGVCKLADAIGCDRWKHVRSVMLDRHKYCPLVEVPTPHGDLIDGQQIYNKVARKTVGALEELVKLNPFKDTAEFLWKNAILKEREDLKFDVVYAPIIIESEE